MEEITPGLHKLFQVIKKKKRETISKSLYEASNILITKPDKDMH